MNSRIPRATPARSPISPVHRGPNAVTHTAAPSTFHTGHTAPNAALLIDFDNVTMGIRSDLQTELRNLLSSDIVKGKISVQRAYADWRRYPQYVLPLTEASIDLIYAPAYGSAKKNATDIRLAIDAIELVFTRSEIGTFILLSGDSDFSSLVIKLKEYGKYIIGVGIRESSSDLLVQNCDEYYSYNALAGLVKAGDDDSPRKDPWELVVEAVGRMKRNGDVMRSDRLKQVMQEIDNAFDEKDLGMAKFSRFCLEAAQRGLLKVRKLENGQLEVDVADGTEVVAAPTQPSRNAPPEPRRDRGPAHHTDRPAAVHTGAPVPGALADGAPRNGAPSDESSRSRRGRRGRGGRGRDREDRPRPDAGAVTTQSLPLADGAVVAPTPAHTPVHVPAHTPPAHRPPASTQPLLHDGVEIGSGGDRLSKDEAFDLVRRTVVALGGSAERAVPASAVRKQARELLNRDSQSLAERLFTLILRDAHDADIVDLRRRGDDFDVALAAKSDAVGDQLARAESAAVTAAAPSAEALAAARAPRGMGPRGLSAGTRGRGMAQRKVAPPPELLAIGVVEHPSAPAPARAPVVHAAADIVLTETAAGAEKPARKTRAKSAGTTPRAKSTAKAATKPAAGKGVATATPSAGSDVVGAARAPAARARPRATGRKKTASAE